MTSNSYIGLCCSYALSTTQKALTGAGLALAAVSSGNGRTLTYLFQNRDQEPALLAVEAGVQILENAEVVDREVLTLTKNAAIEGIKNREELIKKPEETSFRLAREVLSDEAALSHIGKAAQAGRKYIETHLLEEGYKERCLLTRGAIVETIDKRDELTQKPKETSLRLAREVLFDGTATSQIGKAAQAGIHYLQNQVNEYNDEISLVKGVAREALESEDPKKVATEVAKQLLQNKPTSHIAKAAKIGTDYLKDRALTAAGVDAAVRTSKYIKERVKPITLDMIDIRDELKNVKTPPSSRPHSPTPEENTPPFDYAQERAIQKQAFIDRTTYYGVFAGLYKGLLGLEETEEVSNEYSDWITKTIAVDKTPLPSLSKTQKITYSAVAITALSLAFMFLAWPYAIILGIGGALFFGEKVFDTSEQKELFVQELRRYFDAAPTKGPWRSLMKFIARRAFLIKLFYWAIENYVSRLADNGLDHVDEMIETVTSRNMGNNAFLLDRLKRHISHELVVKDSTKRKPIRNIKRINEATSLAADRYVPKRWFDFSSKFHNTKKRFINWLGIVPTLLDSTEGYFYDHAGHVMRSQLLEQLKSIDPDKKSEAKDPVILTPAIELEMRALVSTLLKGIDLKKRAPKTRVDRLVNDAKVNSDEILEELKRLHKEKQSNGHLLPIVEGTKATIDSLITNAIVQAGGEALEQTLSRPNLKKQSIGLLDSINGSLIAPINTPSKEEAEVMGKEIREYADKILYRYIDTALDEYISDEIAEDLAPYMTGIKGALYSHFHPRIHKALDLVDARDFFRGILEDLLVQNIIDEFGKND